MSTMEVEWYEYAVNDAVARFESAYNFLCEYGNVHMEVCVGYVESVEDDRASVMPLFSNQTEVPGPVRVVGETALITLNVSPNACKNYGWDDSSMCLWFDMTFNGKPETIWIPPLSITGLYVPEHPAHPITIAGGYGPGLFIAVDEEGMHRRDIHQAWLERDNGIVTGTVDTDSPKTSSGKIVAFPGAKINDPKIH